MGHWRRLWARWAAARAREKPAAGLVEGALSPPTEVSTETTTESVDSVELAKARDSHADRLLTLLESRRHDRESLASTSEEVLALVGELLAHQDTAEAVRVLTPLVRYLVDHDELALRLASLLQARGRVTEAVALLQDLSQRDLVATDAHLALGDHYRQQGDFQRALDHYEAALARDFTNDKARQHADRLQQQVSAVVGERTHRDRRQRSGRAASFRHRERAGRRRRRPSLSGVRSTATAAGGDQGATSPGRTECGHAHPALLRGARRRLPAAPPNHHNLRA